jgi:hypothetical protein
VDAVHSSGLNTVQKHSERTSADGFLSTSHVGNAGSTPAEIAQTFLYIADKSTVLWGLREFRTICRVVPVYRDLVRRQLPTDCEKLGYAT